MPPFPSCRSPDRLPPDPGPHSMIRTLCLGIAGFATTALLLYVDAVSTIA
ncbi:hypothetical protein AB5I41_20750 [Sphingomonas sp. MMS24-JH45]